MHGPDEFKIQVLFKQKGQWIFIVFSPEVVVGQYLLVSFAHSDVKEEQSRNILQPDFL